MKRSVLSLFLLMFFGAISGAKTSGDTIQIEEIKVLASKKVEEAGLKITRPDSMARASTLTTDLSELISGYSPVFIKSFGRGSTATASFRGTAATHTQVLWNGMNLNSPMRGIADLSLIPVFFTDDVYLLHGGSSMVEGSGALGGSIHLRNVPDWASKINLNAIYETGSFHNQKSFLKLMLGGKKFKSNTRLFYETSENNFPFYNFGVIPNRKDTLLNAGYRRGGILQEFYYRHYSDMISSWRLWYQKSDRDLPQIMSYEGSKKEEYQKDNQFRIQYEWKKYSDDLNYHFFTGISSSQLEYFRATPEFDFVNEDSKSKETSFLNRIRLFRKFSNKVLATLSMDANYHQVKVTDNKNNNGYGAERWETSLLMNLHLKPSDIFSGFVLLRSENYDNRVVPLIPSVGLEIQPLTNVPVILSSNVARNYHKPTLNDLYWLPGGNPELKAEDGYTSDFSIKGIFENGSLSFKNEITGFVSRINNWIIWRPASNGAYYWEAGNVKDVLSKGIEYQLTGKAEWNRLSLRSGGNYAYTNTANLNAARSVDKSRGKQLIYIPKHKGNYYISATWQKITLKYDLNYIGKRFTNSSNLETKFERVLNPYWLSKITFDKQLIFNELSANFKLAVENLLNENYQSILWRPMPGRFYTISVAINFKR